MQCTAGFFTQEDVCSRRLVRKTLFSAYQGARHQPAYDMTLKDFSVGDGNYQHALDGGPSDNLGTTTLLDMVNKLYRAREKPKGCFLKGSDGKPILQTVCSWFNQKGLDVCAATQYAQKAQ